jgi:hypothetical protein
MKQKKLKKVTRLADMRGIGKLRKKRNAIGSKRNTIGSKRNVIGIKKGVQNYGYVSITI